MLSVVMLSVIAQLFSAKCKENATPDTTTLSRPTFITVTMLQVAMQGAAFRIDMLCRGAVVAVVVVAAVAAVVVADNVSALRQRKERKASQKMTNFYEKKFCEVPKSKNTCSK